MKQIRQGDVKQVRQGDVLLEVSLAPVGAKIEDMTEFVVAEGEGTGHNHVVRGDFAVIRHGRDIFILTRKGCALVHTSGEHPDHDMIPLPEGMTFKVRRQEEWGRGVVHD